MRAFLISRRWMVGLVCTAILLVGGTFLMLTGKAPAPLPFDVGEFLATTPRIAFLMLHPNPSLKDRISYALFGLKTNVRSATNLYFGATPLTNQCLVWDMLNQCMGVSGDRYLMPPSVAAGSVRFGNTNTLNGSQWVSAFENALETGTTEWWDAKQRKIRDENLVLIRFPEQKTVLVLPREQVAEFQRTNKFGKVDGQ